LDLGAKDKSHYASVRAEIKARQTRVKPGCCCNIVYTSGTTGNPKGVMLSHDNLLFAIETVYRNLKQHLNWASDGTERLVSYLPLSHSASQCTDLIFPILSRVTLTFAKPDALQGSLVDTLKEAKPTAFFAVPRVWEKFEEKLREFGQQQGQLAQSVAGWAKSKALERYRAMQTHSFDGSQIP